MNRPRGTRLINWTLAFVLLGAPLLATGDDSSSQDADDWRFGAEAYLWAPWIEVESETGQDVEISLDDILSNLDMLFMGVFSVGKGKWSLATDLIYFDIESNENANLPLDLVLDDVNLEAWIVTPQVRYAVADTDRHRLQLVAGARYLWIEADLQLRTRPPLPPDSSKASDSGSVWDGIVGATGHMHLSEKWYLGGYLDIGAGDSDFTWQAAATINYQFERLDAAVGYRYLDYDFDSDEAFSDLTVHGPFAGVRFAF